MKPSWDDAPEWAQWLAQDKDGRWWWYEDKPVFVAWYRYRPVPSDKSSYWWGWPDRVMLAPHKGEPNPNWRRTLEQRPVKEVEQ